MRRDFFMPAVELTFEESLALVALAEHVAGGDQLPFTEAAAKAISKMRCNLPPKVQDELEQLDDHVAIHLSAVSPPEDINDVYKSVRQALAARKAMRCKYESLASNGKKPVEFLFKPYKLFFSQRAWYDAVGYHGQRKEVRCLKLNRFSQCISTDHDYEIPKDFSIKKHLGNAWRMIRGEKSYEVELHFDKEFAETISDTHSTQDAEFQTDNSLFFRCKVDGLDEIVWWILSMGPHCVVKKPKLLSQRVSHLASDIVKNYPEH